MIEIRRYNDLGTYNNGWLNAHYHFSFAMYHDPKRKGVGELRVINDDIVAPHSGFEFHPHRDMEIITYVRKGAITHRDNLGNEGKTSAGDVQVMSAGTGIVHAEHNEEDEATNLYQIWIMPHTKNVKPRWEQRQFPKEVGDSLSLLVSGEKKDAAQGALFIHQDATIHGGRLKKDAHVKHALKGAGYLLVSEGAVEVNGEKLIRGDGAIYTGEKQVKLSAIDESEVLIIDVPE